MKAEPERTVNIQDFLEQLAAALTDSDDKHWWTVVPETYPDSLYRTITTQNDDPDRFALNFTFNSKDDRVVVSPDPPSGIDLNGSTFTLHWDKPEIGINATRPINAVLADIQRRLLPEAINWWTTQCADAAASRERYAAVVQFQQDLQTMFPEGRLRDRGMFFGPSFTIGTTSSASDAVITFDRRPHDQILNLLALYYQHILKQGDFSYGR